MKIKHMLIALATGAAVMGCVATAAQATGPLNATPRAASPTTASTQSVAMGAQSLAGGLARSTGSARTIGEGADDGGRATRRHPVLGDDAAPRPGSVRGRAPTLGRSAPGADAAIEVQDA